MSDDPAGRLFDVSEFRLAEHTRMPDATWHTVSLLAELKKQCLRPPPEPAGLAEKRMVSITSALTELGIRGFDWQELLHRGLLKEFRTRISLAIVQQAVLASQISRLMTPLPTGWVSLAQEHASTQSDVNVVVNNVTFRGEKAALWLTVMNGAFSQQLLRWLASAPLDSFLSWTAPGREDFDGAPLLPASWEDDSAISRWLWDRFTNTYLRDWSLAGLKCEYKWLTGRLEAPLIESDMNCRTEKLEAVALEIADKTVAGPSAHADISSALSKNQLVYDAINLLKAGQRAEAASLFDGVRRLNGADPDFHNNYGFCILPDRPGDALEVLSAAAQLGHARNATNLANRLLALSMLGRDVELLELAPAVLDCDERHSYLWDPQRMATPALVGIESKLYSARLAVQAAQRLGATQNVQRWTRVAQLLAPPAGPSPRS